MNSQAKARLNWVTPSPFFLALASSVSQCFRVTTLQYWSKCLFFKLHGQGSVALATDVNRSSESRDQSSTLVNCFLLTKPLSLTPLTSPGEGLPSLLRILNISGDTISFSLSPGSHIIQFATVWWQWQCPRALGLETPAKVHLIKWSKQHFSFALFPELLLLRNCHAI